ncbi:DUF3891 family protein [Anaerobacillus sp. 1_MG-2023]|uniref:DUF3891 family protein n=1 Tax=Bacillales TaxID=1385 RepID=UPI0026E25C5E|nr:DUF3891 family protein [Anaerobacillus sp. 1_MG-2023]MDO6658611.1 DUF3891 family protein [Anaerobacillus sp. 1_MG-2023]
MIVYEDNDCFVMITQHDHALLSGQFAEALRKSFWPENLYQEDVLYAIKHHDRGWIPLDEVPFWNDRREAPYSFLDFPLATKLQFYKKGIEEVSEKTTYGAFLCSKHYRSFFNGAESEHAIRFYAEEENRQDQLKELIDIPDDLLTFHYQLLQFCDDLSLYACFQEPGVQKEEELSWYRNGFPQSFYFLEEQDLIRTSWKSTDTIQISHPLFHEDNVFQVQLKRVPKELIGTEGISKAYQSTPVEYRRFHFSS